MRDKPRQIIRTGIILVVTVSVLAVVWGAWRLRPWVSPGRAMAIGTWKFGDAEFQVWQRKNNDLLEAFATGLFVRNRGGQWQSFCLDHQDSYAPKISIREEGTGFVVFRGSKRLGIFDTTRESFRRDLDGMALSAVVIDSEPPGDWWLEDANAGVAQKR